MALMVSMGGIWGVKCRQSYPCKKEVVSDSLLIGNEIYNFKLIRSVNDLISYFIIHYKFNQRTINLWHHQ